MNLYNKGFRSDLGWFLYLIFAGLLAFLFVV